MVNMDTDALISSVFSRTPIWDKRNKLHANRNIIGTLWMEIASELQYDETALRKKWKYLREKFAIEYTKQQQSRYGDPDDYYPRPKWPYFKQLMFMKDVIQPRPFSGTFPPSMGEPTVSFTDTGPAQSGNSDDAGSQCSQDSILSNESCQSEENTVDNVHFSQGAGPSFQAHGSSKRKRKNQGEDYFKRLCHIEERKLEYLRDKQTQKKKEADDEDLMFLKTLLPHMRKIPQHMKLRFHSRIQSVVEEFAYGPQHNQSDAALLSIKKNNSSDDSISH